MSIQRGKIYFVNINPVHGREQVIRLGGLNRVYTNKTRLRGLKSVRFKPPDQNN